LELTAWEAKWGPGGEKSGRGPEGRREAHGGVQWGTEAQPGRESKQLVGRGWRRGSRYDEVMNQDWQPSREEIREAQGRGDLSLIPGYAGLVAKLHPSVFKTSPKMTAILGYLLDQEWTSPQIVSMAITSDGFLVTDGDFFGDAESLDRNLAGAATTAGLTPVETSGLFRLREIGVEDWQPSAAELVGKASREI
jgi:hypothetical protein